ncbi:MAG: hypothetical protein Q7R97_01980 [Candidatus Daviesbacteria bacterium]|nr:hypothetical protein [Candidatus Daviesbacteria bacterium]
MIITKTEPFTKYQKLIVESLAMDLKRVALGLYRGSNIMADRFKEEALKRSQELEIKTRVII